jgi:hypothetical protein
MSIYKIWNKFELLSPLPHITFSQLLFCSSYFKYWKLQNWHTSYSENMCKNYILVSVVKRILTLCKNMSVAKCCTIQNLHGCTHVSILCWRIYWSKTTLWSDALYENFPIQRCRLQRSSCACAAQSSSRHVNDEHRFTGNKSTLMRSSCLFTEDWKFSLRRPSVSESLFAFKWQSVVSASLCDVRGQTRFRSIIQPSAGLRNWLLCLGGRTNLQNLRWRVIRSGGRTGDRAIHGCSVLPCLRTSVTWWNWLTPHYLQPCAPDECVFALEMAIYQQANTPLC